MSRSANLANATNSLTDTSARHHKVSKVCVDWYNTLTDPTLVAANKDDFRAIRFEIALCIGRAFNELGYSIPDNRGQAPVFTNTATMLTGGTDDLMRWYVTMYNCRTVQQRIEHVKTGCVVKGQRFYPSELYFGGISMSDAEAHPINGDPCVTLFIGGQITIRNGRYPMRCGDKVQWYLDAEGEADLFDEDGLRRPMQKDQNGTLDLGKSLTDPVSVKIRDHTYGERGLTKELARIKPFRTGINGKGFTLDDLCRVFGKALMGAEPYQMVDIKVCRQSL